MQSHVDSLFIITSQWLEGWQLQRLMEKDIHVENEAERPYLCEIKGYCPLDENLCSHEIFSP